MSDGRCTTVPYHKDFAPGLGIPAGYFIGVTKSGKRLAYDFGAIRRYLSDRGMIEQRGRHISGQLEALGLYEDMLRGETPSMLPFTFWADPEGDKIPS